MEKTKNRNNNWIRLFEVNEPKRHTKGFTVYKVTSKVFPRSDPLGVTTLVVWKRYNDFKKLFEELEQIHRQLYLPGKFPVFPKGNLFNRFEADVIEERRAAALTLLQFASTHVQLFTAKIFNKFFEDGYDPIELESFGSLNDVVVSNENQETNTTEDLAICLEPERLWIKQDIESKPCDAFLITSAGGVDNCLPNSNVDSDFNGIPTLIPSLEPCSVPRSQSEFVMPSFVQISSSKGTDAIPASESSSNSSVPVDIGRGVSSPLKLNGTKIFSDSGRKLFGFLPKFPKRRPKASEDQMLSEALSSSYICEAAGYFAVAQDHESNERYEEAFYSYKEGIRILLTGVKDDADPKRKVLVKKKLEKYLSLAESLHEKYLNKKPISSRFTAQSPIKIPSEKSQSESVLTVSSLPPSPLDDLKRYKLVRILDKTVYVVMNLSDKSGSRCYAMKVLPFSSDPIELDKKTLIPQDIPFMVKLFKWFETDSSYVLLLQYAGGGKLIDYINAYQHKVATADIEVEPEEADSYCLPTQAVILDTSNKVAMHESQQTYIGGGDGDQENSICYSILTESDATKIPRMPLTPHTENHPAPYFFNSWITRDKEAKLKESETPKSENEKMLEGSGGDACFIKVPRTCSSKSSAEDLIECSRELLDAIDRTLEEETFVLNDSSINTPLSLVKQRSQYTFSGEFLSRSVENIHFSAFSAPGLDNSVKFSNLKNDGKMDIESLHPTSIEEIKVPKRSIPEGCIKGWAAEMIMCIERYHATGLIYGDLSMRNILLGENGHVLISFKAQWANVDQLVFPVNDYSAPEIGHSPGESRWRIHPSCDYWSLGAILFEIFTGRSVHEAHPEGFHPQTVIRVPSKNIIGEIISFEVRTLLTEINPSLRLGFYGAEEVKSHPCFDGFDWDFDVESTTNGVEPT